MSLLLHRFYGCEGARIDLSTAHFYVGRGTKDLQAGLDCRQSPAVNSTLGVMVEGCQHAGSEQLE
jgi:hypothetical protein